MSTLALYDSQFSAAQIPTVSGYGQIFIDSADGALKWKDGDGNLSTIGAGVDGTGTATRVAEWQDSNTLQAASLIKSGSGILTLSAAADQTLMLTGGGTLALGGFTLTVPATGTAALLATANVFTVNQTIGALLGVNVTPVVGQQVTVLAAATTTKALLLNTPASSVAAIQEWQYNGSIAVGLNVFATERSLTLVQFDNGSAQGCNIDIRRNSNVSTPAAGFLGLMNLGGTGYRIWPDTSGLLRIHTADPTNANDTAGTIVGTQSSYVAAKLLDVELPDLWESLYHVVEAAGKLRGFRYRNGAYNNEHYPIGIITDTSPRYGMDRSLEFPQGKSLNIPVCTGDLFASIAIIDERLSKLEKLWAS